MVFFGVGRHVLPVQNGLKLRKIMVDNPSPLSRTFLLEENTWSWSCLSGQQPRNEKLHVPLPLHAVSKAALCKQVIRSR